MKLVIQIPCHNEASQRFGALVDLRQTLPGFDMVKWLVIDDGSSDDTSAAARAHGAHHVVRHTCNRGLARAFESGLAAALRLGADVIVNTAADNQYCGRDILKLTRPIMDGRADIVVGERPIPGIRHSWFFPFCCG